MKESQNEQDAILFNELAAIEKDFRSRLDALEAQVSELRSNFLSRLSAIGLHSDKPEPKTKTPQKSTKLESVDDSQSEAKSSKAGAKPKATTLVWRAYAEAFRDRYGVEPLRNSTTNSQIKHFVRRIGEDEAAEVARFYVGYNETFYLKCMHPVGLMLKDAETLHARWRSGHFISSSQAQNVERTQANINASKSYLTKKYGNQTNDQSKRDTPKLPLNR